MHGLPIEGLTGPARRRPLVRIPNFPGACIVAGTMVAAAIYLSTTFSFNTAKEWLSVRFAFVQAWRDRWTNWRATRARKRELRQAAREDAARAKETGKGAKSRRQAGKIAGAARRRRKESTLPVAPSQKRARPTKMYPARCREFARADLPELYAEPAPVAPSLWDEMPRAQVLDFEPEPAQSWR